MKDECFASHNIPGDFYNLPLKLYSEYNISNNNNPNIQQNVPQHISTNFPYRQYFSHSHALRPTHIPHHNYPQATAPQHNYKNPPQYYAKRNIHPSSRQNQANRPIYHIQNE